MYKKLPWYFDDTDRSRYVNIDIGFRILRHIEKETGEQLIGEESKQMIENIGEKIDRIIRYQKIKQEIAAERMLRMPVEAALFLCKEGVFRPNLADFEIRRNIWEVKNFLENFEKSLKRWIWNHIKMYDEENQ